MRPKSRTRKDEAAPPQSHGRIRSFHTETKSNAIAQRVGRHQCITFQSSVGPPPQPPPSPATASLQHLARRERGDPRERPLLRYPRRPLLASCIPELRGREGREGRKGRSRRYVGGVEPADRQVERDRRGRRGQLPVLRQREAAARDPATQALRLRTCPSRC